MSLAAKVSGVRVFETESGVILVEDVAHLSVDFMRRFFGVASGNLDCVQFDPLSFQQDGLGCPK